MKRRIELESEHRTHKSEIRYTRKLYVPKMTGKLNAGTHLQHADKVPNVVSEVHIKLSPSRFNLRINARDHRLRRFRLSERGNIFVNEILG
jgi:hypothetical protein